MAAIFSLRLANAIIAPGVGGTELYLFGGLIIAAALIFSGLKELRRARERSGTHRAEARTEQRP